jgi:serine/threonine-protein kinase
VSEDFPALAGFRAGSLVAGYRLEAQVGAGGMAVVFRAHDERLGRLVALKLLGRALAADGAFRRRFIAESRAAAAVDDPHIIPVYEAGEADGVLFIAMRFVRGGDLRLVLEREGALRPARAAAFISPVASALDAAHGAGLVHRDVKPANILVDTRPRRPDHVYLSDFGVSKGAMSSVSLTSPGQFLGTPAYSAPEQIQGRTVDGRTDQYALACVAYQLLTGTPPFERDQGMAVLLAHLSQPPPSPSSQQPDLPAAADQVLARGMAKAPEKRYESCRDFADALREALGLEPYDSGSSVSAPGHRSPRPAAPPPWFSRPAAAGMAAAADPLAARTIDSPPAGAAHGAAGFPPADVIAAGTGAASEAEVSVPTAPGATGTLPGEPGTPTADGPAGAPDIGDARLGAHKADPTGVAARGIDVMAWAARRPISNLISRFVRSEQHTVAGEKSPAVGARGGHRAQPGRARRSGRRRWPIVTTSLVVLLAVVVIGGYVGWRWTQDQYYVGADQGRVVIFRGINERIAGWNLSQPYLRTGIQLAQVPSNDEQTVRTDYATGSLAQVQQTVSTIRADVTRCKDQYTALRDWVPRESAYRAYQAAVALARQHKTRPPAAVVPNPGPQPLAPAATCPASAAFGIPASALPAATG